MLKKFENNPGNEAKWEAEKSYRFSRRFFLRAAALIAGGAGIAEVAAACAPQPNQASTENIPAAIPATGHYTEVPESPMSPPPTALAYLTPAEAALVDAVTARLIPGSASDPGAHEANIVNYIDKKLAFGLGYDEPTYTQGPYAKAYEGSQPPQGSSSGVVDVKKAELDRYGFQSKLNPQQIYRKGLADLQAYANQSAGGNFETLTPDQQDQIIEELEDGKPTNFTELTPTGFFKMIYDDTIDGFFSDPGYGGNQGMVGWKLIQYPGAQRAYTPVDMHDETQIRPPQSLAMLMPFHPGEAANPDVVVPPASPGGITH